MPRGKTAHQSDIDRVMKCLKRSGHGVASIVCLPGGGVEIKPGPLTDAEPEKQPAQPVDDLTAWRERKNGRRATQGSE